MPLINIAGSCFLALTALRIRSSSVEFCCFWLTFTTQKPNSSIVFSPTLLPSSSYNINKQTSEKWNCILLANLFLITQHNLQFPPVTIHKRVSLLNTPAQNSSSCFRCCFRSCCITEWLRLARLLPPSPAYIYTNSAKGHTFSKNNKQTWR